jgi:hypothetical protein
MNYLNLKTSKTTKDSATVNFITALLLIGGKVHMSANPHICVETEQFRQMENYVEQYGETRFTEYTVLQHELSVFRNITQNKQRRRAKICTMRSYIKVCIKDKKV